MAIFTIGGLVTALREQLAADISPRTVRYYVTEDLLRRPDERGKFTEAHLDRLKLIVLLKQTFMPLPEIRQRLHLLSDSDVAAEVARLHTEMNRPAPGLAAEYTGRLLALSSPELSVSLDACPVIQEPELPSPETWTRFRVSESIELHVREPLSPPDMKLLTALLDIAQKRGRSR